MFRKKLPKQGSGACARQRIDDLLLSERLDCSPQMIASIKHETLRAIRKYITIEESQAALWVADDPPALFIKIPLKMKREESHAETI